MRCDDELDRHIHTCMHASTIVDELKNNKDCLDANKLEDVGLSNRECGSMPFGGGEAYGIRDPPDSRRRIACILY
jgi:hypothetical protein